MDEKRILKNAYTQLDIASENLQIVIDFLFKEFPKQERSDIEPYAKAVDYVANSIYEVMERIKSIM